MIAGQEEGFITDSFLATIGMLLVILPANLVLVILVIQVNKVRLIGQLSIYVKVLEIII